MSAKENDKQHLAAAHTRRLSDAETLRLYLAEREGKKPLIGPNAYKPKPPRPTRDYA